MGKVVLSLCLALSLTACDLTGPDVVDPDSSEVVESPVDVAVDVLIEGGVEDLPVILADVADGDIGMGTYTAVGGTLLAAVLALMATRKRRAAIKAKRKAQGLD